ncbi:10961_t:CDS:2, partial [Scutellospora calospora]
IDTKIFTKIWKEGMRKTDFKKSIEPSREIFFRGIVEKNEVPKLETIQNWISHYASQHHQNAAEIIAQA